MYVPFGGGQRALGYHIAAVRRMHSFARAGSAHCRCHRRSLCVECCSSSTQQASMHTCLLCGAPRFARATGTCSSQRTDGQTHSQPTCQLMGIKATLQHSISQHTHRLCDRRAGERFRCAAVLYAYACVGERACTAERSATWLGSAPATTFSGR